MERTERFYRIKQMLRGAGSCPRVFLEALEVSKATFKRDLEYLRDRLHAPIDYDRDAGGYRLTRRRPALRAARACGSTPTETQALLTMQHLLENLQPGLLSGTWSRCSSACKALIGSGDHSAEESRAASAIAAHGGAREAQVLRDGGRRAAEPPAPAIPTDRGRSDEPRSATSRRSASCTTARTGTSTPGATCARTAQLRAGRHPRGGAARRAGEGGAERSSTSSARATGSSRAGRALGEAALHAERARWVAGEDWHPEAEAAASRPTAATCSRFRTRTTASS